MQGEKNMLYFIQVVETLKVLIDADGCPVVDIVVRICRHYKISCLLLCDTSHEFCREGVTTLIFDKGTDSVDYALANRVSSGDLVVTQDYGLASLCLARGASVLHQDGWEYTAENIDALLLSRYEARKQRASGGRLKGLRKRTHSQNAAFEAALHKLLQTAVQG